jgi:hypothetical protein
MGTTLKKVQLWTWRVATVGFALVLIPLSFWYAVGAISVLDCKAHVSNALAGKNRGGWIPCPNPTAALANPVARCQIARINEILTSITVKSVG